MGHRLLKRRVSISRTEPRSALRALHAAVPGLSRAAFVARAPRDGREPSPLPSCSSSMCVRAAASVNAAGQPQVHVGPQSHTPAKTLTCVAVTARDVGAFVAEAREAVAACADVVELRLDYIAGFDAERDLHVVTAACGATPYILTYRPTWEGCAPAPPRRRNCNGVPCVTRLPQLVRLPWPAFAACACCAQSQ